MHLYSFRWPSQLGSGPAPSSSSIVDLNCDEPGITNRPLMISSLSVALTVTTCTFPFFGCFSPGCLSVDLHAGRFHAHALPCPDELTSGRGRCGRPSSDTNLQLFNCLLVFWSLTHSSSFSDWVFFLYRTSPLNIQGITALIFIFSSGPESVVQLFHRLIHHIHPKPSDL